MKFFKLFLAALIVFSPAFVFAGSQTFNSSGTFTVPNYAGTLNVTVNGAGGGGGGGGGGWQPCSNPGPGGGSPGGTGGSGGTSSFGTISASGGGGGSGSGGSSYYFENNFIGGPKGGLGGYGGTGAPATDCDPPAGGGTTGDMGEDGHQASASYSPSVLTPGTVVPIQVGSGGYGGGNGSGITGSCSESGCGGSGGGAPGQPGQDGSVVITWTDVPPTCSVTFDQNPLTGNSTTMHWTSSGASLFYINNVGYVGASGSAQVFSTGDYSGTVSGSGGIANCPATLAASGGAGSGNNGNNNGGSCTPTAPVCQLGGNLLNNCGAVTTCEFGCSTVTNTCNTSTTCQSYNVCDASGTKVLNACTGATITDCAAQNKICSAGQCVAPVISFVQFSGTDFNGGSFTATGHLEALPTLVPQGATTRLYWSVSNATSCTVSGGSDSWTALSSGTSGKTTSPVTEQTTYTLSCAALPGAIPAHVTETATINVVPVFIER